MQKVIQAIKETLQDHGFENIDTRLSQQSDYLWEKSYPIAVVHHKSRIKGDKLISFLEDEDLLDSEGFTPHLYTKDQLVLLSQKIPNYLQSASMMCLTKPTPYPLAFKNKYPKDYWKKLQSINHIKSIIEFSTFDESDTLCSSEFTLREIMRKRKEVNLLKGIGFVWIAQIPKTISLESLMKHYFNDHFTIVEKDDIAYYIGWSKTLQGINMRYFVCPPKK